MSELRNFSEDIEKVPSVGAENLKSLAAVADIEKKSKLSSRRHQEEGRLTLLGICQHKTVPKFKKPKVFGFGTILEFLIIIRKNLKYLAKVDVFLERYGHILDIFSILKQVKKTLSDNVSISIKLRFFELKRTEISNNHESCL